MSVDILADDDILTNHIILMRNAIKKILTEEPRLSDVRGWHNTISSERGWAKPYGYVLFKIRNPLKDRHDIVEFNYSYQIQVGIVIELLANDEDAIDDKALILINLVESALTKNGDLLGTADLDYFEKQLVNEDLGFLPNHRHLALRVNYTNGVLNET